MTSTEEHREIEIELGGETRTVTVTRLSPLHCWYVQGVVLIRCRTGTKRHRCPPPQVVDMFIKTVTDVHVAVPDPWKFKHELGAGRAE